MAMKKITRRWLVNGLGVIFVILLGVMIAFSFGVRSFYYSSVQQIIISRSSVILPLNTCSTNRLYCWYAVSVRREIS